MCIRDRYTAMPESNSIEKTYMYRYEQSGTSYDIRVKGQEIDDSDKELLEGIVLKLSLIHIVRIRRRRRHKRNMGRPDSLTDEEGWIWAYQRRCCLRLQLP